MTKRVPLLASICACLVLSGCNVSSNNPLSDPNASKPDDRLLGVWRGTDEKNGDVIYYHVGRAGGKLPSGMLRMVGIIHEKNSELGEPGGSVVFTTNLKGADYINLPLHEDNVNKTLKETGWKNPDEYVIVRYKIDGDKLRVWGMDEDAVKKAIESKQLAGSEVARDFFGLSYKITAPTADLARYISEAGDSLFSKEAFVLERVK